MPNSDLEPQRLARAWHSSVCSAQVLSGKGRCRKAPLGTLFDWLPVLCIHIEPVLELKGASPGLLLPTALPIQSCLFQGLETPSPPASPPGSCFLEPSALGCCLASRPGLSWGGRPEAFLTALDPLPTFREHNGMSRSWIPGAAALPRARRVSLEPLFKNEAKKTFLYGGRENADQFRAGPLPWGL